MTKGELAENLFRSGLNCSQAVAVSFCEETGLDENLVKKLTHGFGGGMGRLREVCGAMSGTVFVLSAIYGNEEKAKLYERIQTVASEFKLQNGSLVCRELLNLNIKGADSPTPEKRTELYYKKRPCPKIIASSADILEKYIKSHPIS